MTALLIPEDLRAIVATGLVEDVGHGDVTTLATIPAETAGSATFLAKDTGVLAGMPLLREVYAQVDASMRIEALLEDGAQLTPGTRIAEMTGPAQGILIGERLVLNFLQYLSGIATRTRRFVDLVEGTGARVIDTRKTVPGLRRLAKYAVRIGGGHNHRFGLYDGVLIKDNHIQAAGSITAAVQHARDFAPHLLKVEVETDALDQVREALAAGADIILLDNMPLDVLREGVALCRGKALTEASGGVNETTIRAIAETGVDLISVGAITHSVTALDISLDWALGVGR